MPLLTKSMLGLRLKVGDEEGWPTAAVEVAGGDPHAGDQAGVALDGTAGEHCLLDKLTAALIVKEVGWLHIVGDVDVGQAVVVEVVDDDREARRRAGLGDAGGDADVAEFAVAEVLEQFVMHRRERVGRTGKVFLDVAIEARGVFLDVGLDIVADIQIEQAVAIDVAPGGAGGPVRMDETRLGGGIDEASATLAVFHVVIERDPLVGGDEEVVEAVVVVIADGAAHAVTGVGQARFFGDIGERAVAIVAIEFVRRERAGVLAGAQRDVLHEEKVGEAVAVVIDPGDAAAHRFHDVLDVGGAVEMDEVDAG